MLEKPAVQNIAACENQSKQSKLTDHWTSIKRLFLKKKKKKTVDNAKKTKRLTEMQVLTKDFTSHKIKYNRREFPLHFRR